MKPRNFLPVAAASLCLVALAGCGNKGPLVRPSDVPPPAESAPAPATTPATTAPATPPADDDDTTLPDLTAPESPAMDDVAPPPVQGDGG